MNSDYRFVTRWTVTATVPEVMAILGDGPSLTRWWPSVCLAVGVLDEGSPEGLAARMAPPTNGWRRRAAQDPAAARWVPPPPPPTGSWLVPIRSGSS